MAKTTLKTQKDKILNHLKKRRLSLTEAKSRYSVMNLSARISELRDDGYDICVIPKSVTGKTSVYRLN